MYRAISHLAYAVKVNRAHNANLLLYVARIVEKSDELFSLSLLLLPLLIVYTVTKT